MENLYCIFGFYFTMIKIYLFGFLFFTSQFLSAQNDLAILSFINESVLCNSFTEYRATHQIGNQLSSPSLGIKFYTNPNRQTITAVLLAYDSLIIDFKKYNRFTGKIPFAIQNRDVIKSMISDGFSLSDSSSLSYIFVKDKLKSEYIFSDKTKQILNYTLWSLNENFIEVDKDFKTIDVSLNEPNFDYLVKAIITVLSSSSDLRVKGISQNSMLKNNLWNYKYVYNTDLKIPGELYSMVYSFPFQYSQKDYVSVLAESGYSNNISQTYYRFLKQLRNSFKEDNGWLSYAEKNPNTRSLLDDVYFKHPSYGTFVLDYSQTPKGKEVVYLRFLFQYQ